MLRDYFCLLTESEELCIYPAIMIDYILKWVNKLEGRNFFASSLLRRSRLGIVHLVESKDPIWAVNEEFGVVIIDGYRNDVRIWLYVSMLKDVLLSTDHHLVANWLHEEENLQIIRN